MHRRGGVNRIKSSAAASSPSAFRKRLLCRVPRRMAVPATWCVIARIEELLSEAVKNAKLPRYASWLTGHPDELQLLPPQMRFQVDCTRTRLRLQLNILTVSSMWNNFRQMQHKQSRLAALLSTHPMPGISAISADQPASIRIVSDWLIMHDLPLPRRLDSGFCLQWGC